MAGSGSNGSCCCERRFQPCAVWSSFCSWYVRLLERFFGLLGEKIAQHPLLTIPLCLVFVSVCSVGFVWFEVENRTEKLFIPQRSRAIDDLNMAEKFFRVRFREEIILLVSSSDYPNVLNPECLTQAIKAHNTVVKLDSYSDLCVTLSGGKAASLESCMMINPLEILHFNESYINEKDLTQVQFEINRAYKNSTKLMRNGRSFRFNFERMFGHLERDKTTQDITGAKALQMTYLIRDPSEEEANQKVLEWEKSFIDKVSAIKDKLPCFQVHYSSERSLDDAIAESSGSDITLVSVTFTLMITFACVMLGKFLNPLTGHTLLANAGVFAVALGILAGFGLAMWCRVPFVSIVGVLPFLILGIGIDDMFILVDELDRQPREMTVAQTVKEVMSRSGVTVTMTTVTDLVAFAVSTSTSFPSIRYFCVYAALTVTFSYLMIITYFVAIMSYDVKRIKSSRRDCLPFCRVSPTKEDGSYWDEPQLQVSNRIMIAWGKLLTLIPTKVFVVVFSLALLAAGIYGATKVDESFDRRILAKDGSYLKKFLSAQEHYFKLSIPVSIVESSSTMKYAESSTRDEIKRLSTIVSSNKHYEESVLSWMDEFTRYANKSNTMITASNFMDELKKFLSIPQYAFLRQDLKFSLNGTTLEAWRIIGFMKNSTDSIFQKNAMLSLREDLADQSKLSVYPIARPFIFFEQYAITSRETIRNLLIAALAVLIVTSPFLVDCSVTILVVLNFVALVLELFGLMVLWDVSLNSVSMINLVMAIGFAVDYSAHIAHAYVMSEKETANDRVVDALSTLGASVLMGGFSTFLGMVVLAFAASEIFRIFFRMFLGIVLFGLLHGLCIVPVYLSLFCWRPAITKPLSGRVSVESLPETGDPLGGEVIASEEGKKELAQDYYKDGDLGMSNSNEAIEMAETDECGKDVETSEGEGDRIAGKGDKKELEVQNEVERENKKEVPGELEVADNVESQPTETIEPEIAKKTEESKETCL